jgi:hypothetical protein
MRLVLGNRDAVERTPAEMNQDGTVRVPEVVNTLPPGKRATDVHIREDADIVGALNDVVDSNGLWAAHATAGSQPAWIACDEERLVTLLKAVWPEVEVRVLDLGLLAGEAAAEPAPASEPTAPVTSESPVS